jgi:hypothetical protein
MSLLNQFFLDDFASSGLIALSNFNLKGANDDRILKTERFYCVQKWSQIFVAISKKWR